MVRHSDSLQKYLTELAGTDPLTRAEETTLIPAAQAGDKRAFDKVIKGNLRFVVSIANDYQNKGLPIMDIIGEGNLGLFRALKSFDASRGIRFITYAKWWIRQSITYALLYKSHMVRIPQSQLRKARKARMETEEQIQKKPSLAEALYTGINETMLSGMVGCMVYQSSLDQTCGEDNSNKLIDCIPNQESVAPDHDTNQASLRYELKLAFRILNEREVDVIRMLFGFHGSRATLDHVAVKYGISRERVRQIKNHALEKLRDCRTTKAALIQYLE